MNITYKRIEEPTETYNYFTVASDIESFLYENYDIDAILETYPTEREQESQLRAILRSNLPQSIKDTCGFLAEAIDTAMDNIFER